MHAKQFKTDVFVTLCVYCHSSCVCLWFFLFVNKVKPSWAMLPSSTIMYAKPSWQSTSIQYTFIGQKLTNDQNIDEAIYLLILSRSISDHHLRCGVGG